MKKNFVFLCLIPFLMSCVLTTQKANADLIVDITGFVGEGTTNWIFSGAEVAGAGEDFDSGFLSDFGSVWVNQGDFLNSGWTNTNIVPPSGATVTTSRGTRNIDLLYMAEQGDGPDGSDPGKDDFGIGVEGPGNLAFDSGETVTWTGSFVLNEDIGNMKEGSFRYDYFANIFDTLTLTVNISYSTVPEPSGLLVLGWSGVALLGRRRRSA